MPTPIPTTDELLHTLRRTNLPTVLVEGGYDIFAYRHVEKVLKQSFSAVDILPCGGRPALLEIYDFIKMNPRDFQRLSVAFIADSDFWIFTGVPAGYEEVVWTRGYSIENDLYEGSDIERFMELAELDEYRLLLRAVCSWFAFEVNEYLNGRCAVCNVPLGRLVPLGKTELSPIYTAQRGYAKPSIDKIDEIYSAYGRKLRGKQLFECLARILNANGRSSRYNYYNLIDICLKHPDHPGLGRIANEVVARLAR